MKKRFKFAILIASAGLLLSVEAFSKPLALVWSGPGACRPTCLGSARAIARRAGFDVMSVYPGFKDYEVFKRAKLWIHPGGKSTTGAKAMGPELMDQVREFVKNGGGYVGFCAGAFISTAQIGTTNHVGFGFTPGRTELLIKEGRDKAMIPVRTKIGLVKMYYSGGPFLEVSESDLRAAGGEVMARYPDGKIAGIFARYGKGKVAVIGTHPEADFLWKLSHGYVDVRGTRFFADYMVKYATTP